MANMTIDELTSHADEIDAELEKLGNHNEGAYCQ